MLARLFLLSLLISSATALGAADEKPATKSDPAEVRKLVEQLGSDDFATREKATKELSKLEEAPEALREATKSNDPEVFRRAQIIVDLIAARAEDKVLKEWVHWSVTKDFISNSPHDPLVAQDQVIVGTDQGQLRAYRCQDGNSVWVHQHGARIFHRPCSDGQRIYFSSEKGLTAVKVEDGTEVWSLGQRCCDGPTLVLAKLGRVFVGGNDGNLYALEAKTGEQVWASDFIADAPPDLPDFPGERARMANSKARPTALASDGETVFLSVSTSAASSLSMRPMANGCGPFRRAGGCTVRPSPPRSTYSSAVRTRPSTAWRSRPAGRSGVTRRRAASNPVGWSMTSSFTSGRVTAVSTV